MIANTTKLNTPGAALSALAGVHAMTDVTGFGLAGHALEMARGSQHTVQLKMSQVPLLHGVRELAERHEQLKALSQDDSEAKRKLREIERDQRYFNAQLERAEVVDPAGHPAGEVRFGATVKVEEADGRIETFHIVGDDEADVAVGKISWGSPLARSLIGAKVGETVKWQRPAGDTEVEIVAVEYR
jgi:transcription elongation GreA/GreB family factor